MESSSVVVSEKMVDEEEPLLNLNSDSVQIDEKGGFKTLPFIVGSGALNTCATYGLNPNMILYLMKEYHMDMASGSNVTFIWSAATNFTPVLGAFMADSFVGRFKMIGFGSVITLVGMILFWLTSVIPQLRPPTCAESSNICSSASVFQVFYLYLSLAIIALGTGGVQSSCLAFGSDQLEKEQKQENVHALESYLNWFYAVYTLSILMDFTALVYIQDKMGWELGFGVPIFLAILSTFSIFIASPFYVKLKPKSSLITGFVQVSIASYRNRRVRLSLPSTDTLHHQKKGSMLALPSQNLRFLNKACIVHNPQKDLTPDGEATDPWRLCTVDQVEELKSLLKVIPIWLTGVVISITTSQTTFTVLQATYMDRHIGPSFEIPAGSTGTFNVIFMIVWFCLYERLILPLASRMMRRTSPFSTKEKMGFANLLSFLATLVTAAVEAIRRNAAIKNGADMSLLWVLPQYILSGFAGALITVSQTEFYMSEFPKSMTSVASTLCGVATGLGSMLASLLMSSIDYLTKRGGKESWVSSNINKGHYDYYFLVLAVISLVDLLCYIACCRAYGPCKGEDKEMMEEHKS